MSNLADFDLKERVRSSVDIVDVIGATLELHPAGRNYSAICPWHPDRRPSLTVNRQRQTWKCWPCDIGGDVFDFVMKRDGVDFPGAIRILAEQAGIPIEEYTRGKKTIAGNPDDKATLLSAVRLVADSYYALLENPISDDAKIARQYLADRGIDDENRKRFQVGFAPDEWSYAVDLLKKNGFTGEVAEAAGVASPKRSGSGHVDMFRGRLMFPIHDLQNRPISMGGRVIPAIADRHGDKAGGKYINGRETKLFRKSFQLYGMQLARDSIRRDGQALVMEGYTDVVAARQAGIEPVVAVLGTALGTEHIKLLNRFAERVVLVLDGDDAGQRRADEVLELFVQANVDLRILTLPDGSDPADYIAANGADAFRQIVSEAPDALDHKLNKLVAGVDVTNDTHAVTAAIDTMLGIIGKAKSDSLKVDQMMIRMSRTFGIKGNRLEERLRQIRDSQRNKKRYQPATAPSAASGDPNAMLAESADDPSLMSVGQPAGAMGTVGAGNPANATNSSEKLEGIDRDLFEVLIEAPELAAMAVEGIDPSWLQSITAKMLLSAYQELELEGRELTADSLLLFLENGHLKNQIVTLDHRVQERKEKASQTPQDRYTAIITLYHERAAKQENEIQIAKLESEEMEPDEEAALLQELINADRQRHGIKTN